MTAKRAAKTPRPEPVDAEPVCELTEDDAAARPVCVEPDRIIVFRMESQEYALPIEAVQEIQQLVAISEIPQQGGSVVGVINVRGVVVPVLDLRLLVGMPRKEYGLQTPMLFVNTARGLVALIVDEVEDVIEVPAGAAQAPSGVYALADKLSCIVRLETDVVFVFDIDRLVPPEAAMAGR